MNKVVGIGECIVSRNENDIIKTFSLASCVAVIAYNPSKKIAGMIHIALPSPTYNINKAKQGYYATTGVPLLINKLCKEYGCTKSELEIYIYGGANSINKNDLFNIGKRNIEAVVNILDHMNLNVHKAEVGGIISRTLELNVSTGGIKIFTQPINI